MVKFNVEEETGFITSVQYLGEIAFEEIFDALSAIEARNLEWDEFVKDYGWEHIELIGQDTYPGADPLYYFGFIGPSGKCIKLQQRDLMVLWWFALSLVIKILRCI